MMEVAGVARLSRWCHAACSWVTFRRSDGAGSARRRMKSARKMSPHVRPPDSIAPRDPPIAATVYPNRNDRCPATPSDSHQSGARRCASATGLPTEAGGGMEMGSSTTRLATQHKMEQETRQARTRLLSTWPKEALVEKLIDYETLLQQQYGHAVDLEARPASSGSSSLSSSMSAGPTAGPTAASTTISAGLASSAMTASAAAPSTAAVKRTHLEMEQEEGDHEDVQASETTTAREPAARHQDRASQGDSAGSEGEGEGEGKGGQEGPGELHTVPRSNRYLKRKNRHLPSHFDYAQYSKRHIALKIAYFGWNYKGFAIQTEDVSTVETYLLRALTTAKLMEDFTTCNYARCGRTDSGVSAFGQVVSLDVRSTVFEGLGVIPALLPAGKSSKHKGGAQEIDYTKALNACLPSDIRVLAWAPVPLDFDARFSCLFRKYKYFFLRKNLNLGAMNEAAHHFVGVHDFRNFCKINFANGVRSFTRRIIAFDVQVSPISDGCAANDERFQICEMTIVGFAFLWHQVRCMAQVLFFIGEGLEKPDVVKEMLDISSTKSRPNYTMASEYPLVLYDCVFEDVDWQYDPRTQALTYAHLANIVAEPLIQSTIMSYLFNHLKHVAFKTSHVPSALLERSGLSRNTSEWIPWKSIAAVSEAEYGYRRRHMPIIVRARRPTVRQMFVTHIRKKMRKSQSVESTSENTEGGDEEGSDSEDGFSASSSGDSSASSMGPEESSRLLGASSSSAMEQ